ncbi:MAG: amine dehydrogenase large subunit [Halioglobus sp.]
MKKLLKPVGISLLLALSSTAFAQSFVPEEAFTETLPQNTGQEWFWAYGFRMPSAVDGQAFLFDEHGNRLGQLSTGYWFNSLINAELRNEIITTETYFSRGTRGERTDIVSIYDAQTLSPKKEIIIPSKRMNSVKNNGLMALTDDQKFALIVNYTPAQSISIVNLELGEFVEEVETPGCSVIYGAGNRNFYAICANGSFMQIKLGEDGKVTKRQRSKKLFNAVDDFLSIAASRIGNTWYFVSRQYNVYAIKMDGDTIELVSTWPLASKDEREDNWTIAGLDHTAAHEASNRLYVLMHQGESHQFEEPGTHVWVYNATTGEKLQEIELEEMSLAMKMSQSETPRLYTLNVHFPMPTLFAAWIYIVEGEDEITKSMRQRISAYDALSGDHLFFSDLVPTGGLVLHVQAW